MDSTLEKVKKLQGSFNVSEYARFLEIPQRTLDAYMKGDRKMSINLLKHICAKHKVSADYLLGLSDAPATISQSTVNGHNINGNSNVVAAEPCADADEVASLKAEIQALKNKLEYATELIAKLTK